MKESFFIHNLSFLAYAIRRENTGKMGGELRNGCSDEREKVEMHLGACGDANHRKSVAQSVCVASERVYGAYCTGQ